MRVVVALGGNALQRRGEAMTADNQRANVKVAAEQLAAVLVRIRREVLPAPEVLLDPGAFKKETPLKKKKFSSEKKSFAAKRPWIDRGKKQGGSAPPKPKKKRY